MDGVQEPTPPRDSHSTTSYRQDGPGEIMEWTGLDPTIQRTPGLTNTHTNKKIVARGLLEAHVIYRTPATRQERPTASKDNEPLVDAEEQWTTPWKHMWSSPCDSGYNSGMSPQCFPSPQVSAGKSNIDRLPSFYEWPSVDGTTSTGVDHDSEDEPEPCPSPRVESTRSGRATLPRRAPRTRPTLPIGFCSEGGVKSRRTSSKSGTLRKQSKSARLGHLDRFIPSRCHTSDLAEMLKTNKDVQELTVFEKLLRNEGPSTDPFVFRRGPVAPMASAFRILSRSHDTSRSIGTVIGPRLQNTPLGLERGWAFGGAPGGTGVDNGRGQLVSSGTNARLYRTSFSTFVLTPEEEMEKHEDRLAKALGLDRNRRMLGLVKDTSQKFRHASEKTFERKTRWDGVTWVNDSPHIGRKQEVRPMPAAPFKVLDAPGLRDDFYCSVLAYSSTSDTLAVGLGDLLYGWSEAEGVRLLHPGYQDDAHLTCLGFSSAKGGKSILAFGRTNRILNIMSTYDQPVAPRRQEMLIPPRFDVCQPSGVSALAWRPRPTMRRSVNPRTKFPDVLVPTEDLLVGDEAGHVYYYSVEWPGRLEMEKHDWPGSVTLIRRIAVHSQQICGLAWSWKGDTFATGGNDNSCFLFESVKIIGVEAHKDQTRSDKPLAVGRTTHLPRSALVAVQTDQGETWLTHTADVREGDHKHKWTHGAAVKAIAFCPWQEGLVATGGGSNDRCIHFYHTTSGTALATISVSAQVTSLVWSTTRREIAATFGYTQPEHKYRIAVFAWPSCAQVAAVPWVGPHRALYAIPYPGVAKETPDERKTRRREGLVGSMVMAWSDGSVKFHEVWPTDTRRTVGGPGMLGGSVILDSMEGNDMDGEVIR